MRKNASSAEGRAVFRANFPPVLAAIKIGQDGMRLQFDVPESEMDNASPILKWRDRVLIVTVVPE